ncbi:sensor protein ZraS [Chania multitudinisentens RB-25]|uniref:Sensor histidine kinase ZraS n=1 Tax=Chania multitudinisentens RB-25 TaxID=1441930 RepID=W0LG76_9GAMM|nr:ATP-binding protein [Chania multitudinisentens]AHG21292.1 sensor protein ZraS [Chania multitudinisentens RB-25]
MADKKKSGLLSVWILIGSVMILIGIIITMAIKDLNRGREIEIQTLREKSAVLIRSFESGARTGMGMRWRQDQRQILLEEMAYQPGVLYIAITDASGYILAHSDPARVGTPLYSQQEMDALKVAGAEQWHMTTFIDQENNRQNAFETYRFFKPLKRGSGHGAHMMGMHRTMAPEMDGSRDAQDEEQNIIFAAFDTLALDATQAKDIRNTVILLAILALLVLACLLALFWARRYQRSRQQLQDSRTFSTEIISNLPIGLITTNEHQQISVVNQAAEAMLGSPASGLLGQNIHRALPAEWNQRVENHRNGQPVIEHDIDYQLANGQFLPLSISVANIVNDSGNFLGNLFIFRDMREVRQLQDQVRRKEKLAAIGDLAAGLAHEIRNPLSSIKGFAKYFENRSPQNSEEQALAKVMAKEVDRLNRVISELLALVRPVDLRLQQVNINEVIAHSLHLIRQDAENKNITIRYCSNEMLPAIEIDPDRFTQVLLNLYLNAIQAIGANGLLEVGVTQRREEGLCITVTDSGKGIGQDELTKVFNPYFTTKATGTGLGLTIVQKVIEEHQGKITVTSHPQSGTRFEMVIPLKHKKQEASEHGDV